MKKPKTPKPTAQQVAVERRQARALDEEIEEQEERFKAMARGKLGVRSLLGGAPRSRQAAAMGGGRAAPARTFLGGGGGVSPSRPGRGGGAPGTTPGFTPDLK